MLVNGPGRLNSRTCEMLQRPRNVLKKRRKDENLSEKLQRSKHEKQQSSKPEKQLSNKHEKQQSRKHARTTCTGASERTKA